MRELMKETEQLLVRAKNVNEVCLVQYIDSLYSPTMKKKKNLCLHKQC